MTPRFTRIVATDWPALFSAVVIPMVLLLVVAYPMFGPSHGDASEQVFFFGLPIAAVAFSVLCWRVFRVLHLFSRGVQVEGTIARVQLVKDRGRVEFSYLRQGRMESSWQPVHKTKAVQRLEPGQAVQLLVHPTKSKVAIIRHLFV
jgi:hypothetical protein